MIEVRYLVDNNVLSKLSLAQRSDRKFRDRCRIPSEVLFEAAGFPDIDQLCLLEFPVTPRVLEQLRHVMSTVSPSDSRLVDLYGNKGNADPLLIATALVGAQDTAGTLFPEDWQIVTDDRGVRLKAAEFGVHVLSAEEFLAHLAP